MKVGGIPVVTRTGICQCAYLVQKKINHQASCKLRGFIIKPRPSSPRTLMHSYHDVTYCRTETSAEDFKNSRNHSLYVDMKTLYQAAAIFLGSTVTEERSVFGIRNFMILVTNFSTNCANTNPINHLASVTVIPAQNKPYEL